MFRIRISFHADPDSGSMALCGSVRIRNTVLFYAGKTQFCVSKSGVFQHFFYRLREELYSPLLREYLRENEITCICKITLDCLSWPRFVQFMKERYKSTNLMRMSFQVFAHVVRNDS